MDRLFSSIADVRIIWEAIIPLRMALQIPPRSFDIAFADRYSFCTNTDKLVDEPKIDDLARGFIMTPISSIKMPVQLLILLFG